MHSLDTSTRNTLARALKAGSALMVSTLIIAACASGADDPAGEPSDALTSWITEAEAICLSYDKQARAVVFPEPSEDQEAYVAEVTATVDELEALLIAQRAEVGALEVPEQDGDDVAAMLELLDEQIEIAAELRAPLDEGDVAGMLSQMPDALSEFMPRINRVADPLGVPACGSTFL